MKNLITRKMTNKLAIRHTRQFHPPLLPTTYYPKVNVNAIRPPPVRFSKYLLSMGYIDVAVILNVYQYGKHSIK
jgi:hypothetical protein